LYRAVLETIDESRRGISIAWIRVGVSREPDDPSWEEVCFKVAVRATSAERFAFWERISDRLDSLTDTLGPQAREDLARAVAVHVVCQ
jgi:hypothetical protein